MHRYTIAKQQPHCYNYSEAAEFIILEADNELYQQAYKKEDSEDSPAQIAEKLLLFPCFHVAVGLHENLLTSSLRAKQMDRSPAPLTLGSSITEL